MYQVRKTGAGATLTAHRSASSISFTDWPVSHSVMSSRNASTVNNP
jgi:hypothetical protein